MTSSAVRLGSSLGEICVKIDFLSHGCERVCVATQSDREYPVSRARTMKPSGWDRSKSFDVLRSHVTGCLRRRAGSP